MWHRHVTLATNSVLVISNGNLKNIWLWNFRGKNFVQKKKHSRYLRCYHHHNFWLLTYEYRCAPITTEEPTRQNRTDGMEIDFLKQIRQIRHYTYANTLLSYFWWKFHSQKKFCNRWLILPAAGLNWKHCIYKLAKLVSDPFCLYDQIKLL